MNRIFARSFTAKTNLYQRNLFVNNPLSFINCSKVGINQYGKSFITNPFSLIDQQKCGINQYYKNEVFHKSMVDRQPVWNKSFINSRSLLNKSIFNYQQSFFIKRHLFTNHKKVHIPKRSKVEIKLDNILSHDNIPLNIDMMISFKNIKGRSVIQSKIQPKIKEIMSQYDYKYILANRENIAQQLKNEIINISHLGLKINSVVIKNITAEDKHSSSNIIYYINYCLEFIIFFVGGSILCTILAGCLIGIVFFTACMGANIREKILGR